MIRFWGIGFVDIFLDGAIADDWVLVEFRGVLGVAGVKRVFILGGGVVFGLLFEVGGVIMCIFRG